MDQNGFYNFYDYGVTPPYNPAFPSTSIPRPAAIPEKVANDIELHRSINMITTDNQIRKNMADDQIEQGKEERALKRTKELMLFQDQLDQRKRVESLDFFRRNDGEICMILERPEMGNIAKTEVLGKAVSAKNLLVGKLGCANGGDLPACIFVAWQSGEEKHSFFLAGNHINCDEFWQELHKLGVDVLSSVRAEKTVRTKLFAWLMADAKTIELPRTYGWTKMSDGEWHFIPRDRYTYVETVISGGGSFFD